MIKTAVDKEEPSEDRISVLDSIGVMLSEKRRDAVSAKSQTGIEDEWEGDEEHYQGYDDANRNEFVNTAAKPNIDGKTRTAQGRSRGSVVFPNITQPYVDAAAARVGDMLLPSDDRNYAIDPTPIPQMFGYQPEPEQLEPPLTDDSGGQQPLPDDSGQPAEGMGGEQPGQPAAPVLSEADKSEQEFSKMKAEADRKANLAEDQIDDWLQEASYYSEVRKVIDDAVRLGSGVIKGPVPVKRKSSVWMQDEEGARLQIVDEIKPASLRVDPWNLFPDPACGESIHNGAYIFERDCLTAKKLEELKGVPGYLDSQIDKCLKEGPGNRKESSDRENDLTQTTAKDQFEIWYIHIAIKAEELMECGCEMAEGSDENASYPALMTMVNDHVIKAALNPLDSGVFPYDLIPWKRRPGMPWGMGLSRQLRTPQRMVVAATRRLMDNAGQGSGPQFVVRRGVQPENGIWEIAPLKIWVEEDDAVGGATSPVSSVIIPMMQVELTNIIQLGMKMAEDVTGMPMLMQGQQGKAPDTVGGMTILNNNANSVLRRIARIFDSYITTPHVKRYYAWLMEYGENDDMKGDYQIIARGSTALVERDIQSQEMVSVLQLCLNPAFGKNPKKAMDEYLKSRRFDPGAFDYTEDELKQISEQPQPEQPQVQAAQIRVEADMKKFEMSAKADEQQTQFEAQLAKLDSDTKIRIAGDAQQTSLQKMRLDQDRDNVYTQTQVGREQAQQDYLMQKLMIERDLKMMDLSLKQNISLDKIKADLSKKAMDITATKDLVAMNANAAQLPKPPIEPIGKAEDGKSYTQ